LIKNFNVVGIAQEVKKRDYSKKGEGTNEESVVKEYFNARDENEKYFFGKNKELLLGNYELMQVPAGEINDSKYIKKIKGWKADYFAVFGSSILKEEIISLFKKNHIINIHLGLSPYYRGSGTNFWPQYEEKLEYVGATIHILDEGIDTGEIIHQCRPSIEIGDTPHSIGNKTIKKGVEDYVKIFKKLENKEKILGKTQDLSNGKLYLFKNCEPKHITRLIEKFNNGLVQKYLKTEKDKKKIDIVENL